MGSGAFDLKGLICLLALAAEPSIDVFFLLLGGSLLRRSANQELEAAIERGEDDAVEEEDGVEDVAELRLHQGLCHRCLEQEQEQEDTHGCGRGQQGPVGDSG